MLMIVIMIVQVIWNLECLCLLRLEGVVVGRVVDGEM
jgi:hypothetical protein